ncbi:MAG: tRNA (N6-threonylcarbamoyladenosine(37)-N6)-methyltransferase TrmO [Polyangiaceae bacterium]|nr:tRNA (N6-threonylcarbamoyladenosine(37)-N6)-methyltransferase TrmO [Polyangiaceae bacterium]
MTELILNPIGIVHSPFVERSQAPRQALSRPEVGGVIELFAGRGFEDALSDLGGFSHVWVLSWFDRNHGWRPKVRPPRSGVKRGLFATRSPYRPNPLGMSLLRLKEVEGLLLHVQGLDLLDGTPVLDIKPYIPYADAPPRSEVSTLSAGWLEDPTVSDQARCHMVTFLPRAQEQLQYLAEVGVLLRPVLEQALSLGATPHAYRRIRVEGDYSVLAHKDWRAKFTSLGKSIQVEGIATGYREDQFSTPKVPDIHREFVAKFGFPGYG